MRKKMSLAAAKLIQKTKSLVVTHLPLGSSLIPYDILLRVYVCKLTNEELTVKSLLISLPYSHTGTRCHLKKLISSGWIELIIDKKDARTKICHTTDKFDAAFEKTIKNFSH